MQAGGGEPLCGQWPNRAHPAPDAVECGAEPGALHERHARAGQRRRCDKGRICRGGQSSADQDGAALPHQRSAAAAGCCPRLQPPARLAPPPGAARLAARRRAARRAGPPRAPPSPPTSAAAARSAAARRTRTETALRGQPRPRRARRPSPGAGCPRAPARRSAAAGVRPLSRAHREQRAALRAGHHRPGGAHRELDWGGRGGGVMRLAGPPRAGGAPYSNTSPLRVKSRPFRDTSTDAKPTGAKGGGGQSSTSSASLAGPGPAAETSCASTTARPTLQRGFAPGTPERLAPRR